MSGGSGTEKHTSAAVVRTLGTREATFRPSVGRPVDVKECVLLLDTEPRLLILHLIHNLLGMVTVVGSVGGAVVVVGLGKNEDVVAATERVLEDGGWAEVDVGVIAWGLIGG